uniref:DNA repair protein n=1 Tax=uncultured marine group II/III euryarchaeote KM3_15_B02 TaxID=1457910 RepID=A0A075GHZ4_9EURY|nr:hypothetical protein [uncultured marine group II/III euryarchaeote KM3_15_B02]
MLTGTELAGASPPSVFVGRYGYPKISIGPMLPPFGGDTSLLDTPERWVGRKIDDIVDFRSQLVRTRFTVRELDPAKGNRMVLRTQELAMAATPPHVDATLHKPPQGRMRYSATAQPMGPSAPLKTFDRDTVKVDQRIEKAHSDTDLLARDALSELHARGVHTSAMSRAFSVGAFGLGKRRKLVPTRWSITAVDSTLGLKLLERTRELPLLGDYRLHEFTGLDNRWSVLLLPTEWCYELIEAWYPNTLWNPHRSGISIFHSFELNRGRKGYAEIGGCYYAARLAVNEHLHRLGRQAGAVIFREAHPGYILPVGVWNVREHVRQALREPPRRYGTLEEALARVGFTMDISMKRWIANSGVLKDRMYQKRLDDFDA